MGWGQAIAPLAVGRAELDIAPIWNGVATSSSPLQGFSQGDEDIAAPDHSHRVSVQRRLMGC